MTNLTKDEEELVEIKYWIRQLVKWADCHSSEANQRKEAIGKCIEGMVLTTIREAEERGRKECLSIVDEVEARYPEKVFSKEGIKKGVSDCIAAEGARIACRGIRESLKSLTK